MNQTPKERAAKFMEQKNTLRSMHSASLYERATTENDLTKVIRDAMTQAYEDAIAIVRRNLPMISQAQIAVAELERAKTDLLI